MNFQFYIEKLFDSTEFASFKKENKDAFLCGGFFIIDLENLKNPENKSQVDFFVPSSKKMFSFKLDGGVQLIPVEQFDSQRIPEKVPDNIDFDFDEIDEIVRKKMRDEKMNNKLQKIIISVQNLEKKTYLLCTVFISGMGILKVHISLGDKKITLFEKKSFFDMIKMVKKGDKI